MNRNLQPPLRLGQAASEHALPGISYRSLIRWELCYALILLAWSLSQSEELLKSVSDGFALLLLLRAGAMLLSRLSLLDQPSRVLMVATTFFAAANLIVNMGQENITEAIKILSVFLFFLAGVTAGPEFFDRMPSRLCALLFVGIPVVTALVDLYAGAPDGPLKEIALSFFANRNNAILFSVVASWALTLAGFKRAFIVGYLIVCTIAFNTLGALLAVAVALYIAYFGFNIMRVVVLGGCATAGFMLFGNDMEILSRATSSWQSLQRVLDAAGGFWNIGKLDYGEIYDAAQTTDISLIFRIKHWINVLTIFSDGSLLNQMFGFGVSQSLVLTDIKLLPHNDYLRFCFELGPGMLICFLAMNVMILKRVGIRFIAIPIIFLFIYLFSDNIINNFLVMSFFYFMAGVFASGKIPVDMDKFEDSADEEIEARYLP